MVFSPLNQRIWKNQFNVDLARTDIKLIYLSIELFCYPFTLPLVFRPYNFYIFTSTVCLQFFAGDSAFSGTCVFSLLIWYFLVWCLTVFITFIIIDLDLNRTETINFLPLSHIAPVSWLSQTIWYSSSLYSILMMLPSWSVIIPMHL